MDLPSQDFWLTRDRSEGELSDLVEIWLCRPEAIRYSDGDVTWIAPLDAVDRVTTFAGTVTVALATLELGNGVPASERECLRVGRSRAEV